MDDKLLNWYYNIEKYFLCKRSMFGLVLKQLQKYKSIVSNRLRLHFICIANRVYLVSVVTREVQLPLADISFNHYTEFSEYSNDKTYTAQCISFGSNSNVFQGKTK
jgi:hypothetical protein